MSRRRFSGCEVAGDDGIGGEKVREGRKGGRWGERGRDGGRWGERGEERVRLGEIGEIGGDHTP